MRDKTEIQKILDDIVLFEYEKSYAFIGCARWGKPNWYDTSPPSLAGFEKDVESFSRAIYQFASDFQQGTPFALSSLHTFPLRVMPTLQDYEGDIEYFESDMDFWEKSEHLQCWDVFRHLVEKNIVLIPTEEEFEYMSCNHELNFRCVENVSKLLFENMMAYYYENPMGLFELGHLFICFKDYIIEFTKNGWAVYGRSHADVEFVRWFFTLISFLCNMTPAFLHDTRHPLLDGYNPLKPFE